MTPKFSVCLAAYNGIQYIGDQLQTILSQKNVSVKIFISIDKSTDGTEEFVKKLAEKDDRIFMLPVGKVFGGAGPNFYRLIKEVDFADFDYICFADQDDIWFGEKLFRAHLAILKNQADGYSSNFTAFWKNGIALKVNKSYKQSRWDFLFESAGPGCTYVFTKKLALAFQKFLLVDHLNTKFIDYHDWLIYAFARFNQFKWFIDDWASLAYRQHDNNQLGVNAGFYPFLARVKKILNGYGFSQSRLIAEVIGANALEPIGSGLLLGRRGYLNLFWYSWQCRRRPRDKLFFAISCLLLFLGANNINYKI